MNDINDQLISSRTRQMMLNLCPYTRETSMGLEYLNNVVTDRFMPDISIRVVYVYFVKI